MLQKKFTKIARNKINFVYNIVLNKSANLNNFLKIFVCCNTYDIFYYNFNICYFKICHFKIYL